MKTILFMICAALLVSAFHLSAALAQDEEAGGKGDGAIVQKAEVVVTEDGAPAETAAAEKKAEEKMPAIVEEKKETPAIEKKEAAAEVSETKGDTSAKRTTTLFKTVTGVVSGISKDFIAVEYARDNATGSSREVPLPIGASPILEHAQNVTDIKVGDTVSVQYAEFIDIGNDNKESVARREAKIIRFISPAQPKPAEVTVEEPASADAGETQAN